MWRPQLTCPSWSRQNLQIALPLECVPYHAWSTYQIQVCFRRAGFKHHGSAQHQKKRNQISQPNPSIPIYPAFVGWNIFCSSRVRLVDVPGFGAGGISAAAAAGAGVASASCVGAAKPTTVGMPEPLWAWKVSCQRPHSD